MSLDVTQAIVIEGRKRDFSQASQRLALYDEEGIPLRLPQAGEHGMSVGYAEHKDPIVLGDTMNVLGDASGVDFRDTETYTVPTDVAVTVHVPSGGGIQAYASFDYDWFDTPDDGSKGYVLSALVWPTFDDAMDIGPNAALDSDTVPSVVIGIGEINDIVQFHRADWPEGWPIRGTPGYAVYEFLKPGDHELRLAFAVQQWEMVDGVAQEGTHRVSISNIKLKAIALA